MPDIYETLWAMGVPSSDMTDLKQVKPFRISTVGERLLQRKATEDYFNVDPSGFVENPWGFPFTPLPQRRPTSSGGLVIAPENISFEGLGHPIFWIDPALTRRTPEEREHPERWSVRMFYLIMAFHMCDPTTLAWYNVPNSQGVRYTHEDWLAYRQGTSSILDTVRPLGESDLLEPLSSVSQVTAAALAQCAEAQNAMWATYRAELSAAYTTAVASTTGSSEWDLLDSRIKSTTQAIAAAAEQGAVPSSLVPEVFAQVEELERVVAHTEKCALLMSVPVLTSHSLGDSAAAAATAVKAAHAEIAVDVDTLLAEAHRLFSLPKSPSGRKVVRLHETATAIYMNSWRAMMLSARNLVRAADGHSIYQSWEAFELVEDLSGTRWPPLTEVLSGVGR